MNPTFFNRKTVTIAILCVLLFGVVYCVRLWQPERQVARHQRSLLNALEDRNWERVAALMADDFGNPHRLSREELIKEGSEVLRHFFSLTITEEDRSIILIEPGEDGRKRGEVQALLRMEGRGTPLANEIVSAVNRQKQPFTFRWEQRSAKPWDWQLIYASHPLMDKRGSYF